MDLAKAYCWIILGIITVILFLQFSSVQSAVTNFRVYNERRILDRLASAPLVPLSPSSFSHRSESIDFPLSSPPRSEFSPSVRKERPVKRKKRIRKVLRKRTTTTTTEVTPVAQHIQLDQISPLNNYNNRDIEIYERRRTRRKRPQQTGSKDSSDLQRAESGNPFVNSSAPISSDFSGDGGGLQFHLQILHPLLNGDSVLTHHVPKVPENKTVKILHELSEEVAGEVPVAPDLKKIRRKHPLHNQDSVISGQTQVSKNEPKVAPNTGRRREESTDKKVKESIGKANGVTYVEPFNGRPSSTSFPPITSQAVATTRQRAKPKTTTTIASTTTTSTTSTTTTSTTVATTARPTIRLTNPTPRASSTTTTTTTTERPSTVILSPLPYTPTTVPNQSGLETGNPQVIIFPPEEDRIPPQTTSGVRTTTPISQEQEILNQLLGLGQSNIGNNFQRPNLSSPISTNTNFFDIFNLFQSTTPLNSVTATVTTPKPSPVYPASTTTTKKPRRTTTEAQKPAPTTSSPVTLNPKPTQSQAELDNLLQLALLEGLIQSNQQGSTKQSGNGNNGNDLSSLLSLLETQSNGAAQTTAPPPPPPPTSPPSLQAALSNMLSILTNPFGQQQRQQQQPQQSTNIFGSGTNLFGGGGNGGLFGGGNSLFSGSNGGGLLGGNSVFNLNPGASSQRTTVVPKPTTTPAPTASDSELLAQLLQLGIAADQQERQAHVKKQPPKAQDSGADIQSILAGNWLGNNGKASQTSAATQQPSETMQLLNILFNNHNPTARPSGPYWWLDMNAFMGRDQSADPMAGVRPKLGQREYFIKVR